MAYTEKNTLSTLTLDDPNDPFPEVPSLPKIREISRIFNRFDQISRSPDSDSKSPDCSYFSDTIFGCMVKTGIINKDIKYLIANNVTDMAADPI